MGPALLQRLFFPLIKSQNYVVRLQQKCKTDGLLLLLSGGVKKKGERDKIDKKAHLGEVMDVIGKQ